MTDQKLSTRLTSLDLSECEDLVDVAPLASLTALTSLDLHDCSSLVGVAPLASLTALTSLDLNSIGVALNKICHYCGWAQAARAVHDYIDASCPATPAARRFFGWLTRQ